MHDHCLLPDEQSSTTGALPLLGWHSVMYAVFCWSLSWVYDPWTKPQQKCRFVWQGNEVNWTVWTFIHYADRRKTQIFVLSIFELVRAVSSGLSVYFAVAGGRGRRIVLWPIGWSGQRSRRNITQLLLAEDRTKRFKSSASHQSCSLQCSHKIR